MTIITDNKTLEEHCQSLASNDFLTIDTEFLRDKTYYSRLCLIQLAGPDTEAVAVDPLQKDLDLQPLHDLLANEKIVKVFHASRQDLEIFYNLTSKIPHPLFDTQVAAMVCGYGTSVSYSNLVHDICAQKLDKGPQFTDWSRRPLTKKQLSYALDDVIYLRDVYLHLLRELEKRDRTEWVKEEMGILKAPETYENPLQDSWKRLKPKSTKPKVLSVLREIASWRESEARRRDVPRNRVLRDETLVDMAFHAPKTVEELKHIRNMPKDVAGSSLGKTLLKLIEKGRNVPVKKCPQTVLKKRFPAELTPVLEMLKMLLRIQASENEVALKLIASNTDLESLAQDDKADIPALRGWRYEVFGKEALALKQGRLTIGLKDGRIFKQAQN